MDEQDQTSDSLKIYEMIAEDVQREEEQKIHEDDE